MKHANNATLFFFEQKKIEAPLKNSERVIEKEEVQRVLFDK